MGEVRVQRHIDASPDSVWAVLSDGGTRIAHFERFEGAVGRLVFPFVDRPLTRNYALFLDALADRVAG